MQVTEITSLEKQTINEAPKGMMAKIGQGAKQIGAKLGGKGNASQMSKGLDQVAQGKTLPANLAKQIAPFAKSLETILSDVSMRNKFMILIKQAEKVQAKNPSAKGGEVTKDKTKPNPKIKVAKGAGQLETGDDGETYVWAGAQWINNSSAKMAPREIGVKLTTKMLSGLANEIKTAGAAEQIKSMLTGTKAPAIGPAVR